MGLDMYLTARKLTSNFNFQKPEEKESYNKALEATGLEAEDVASDSPMISLAVTICYWRKANAIHKWFVQNVQGGHDECQESYVSREQLQKLLDEVTKVLANKDKAAELLPTTSGFFFGTTDYNDWYWEDMKKTQAALERILKNPRLVKGWDFYYQASW
jgi:hypothetical protein